jgi:hypothetical protein
MDFVRELQVPQLHYVIKSTRRGRLGSASTSLPSWPHANVLA